MQTWTDLTLSHVCSPDVDWLAVVANARTDTESEVSLARVSLYGVVEVVRHCGSICQPQTDTVTVDKGTVQPRDDALHRSTE